MNAIPMNVPGSPLEDGISAAERERRSAARRDFVYRMREQGVTLARIGDLLGVSAARVKQIADATDAPKANAKPRRRLVGSAGYEEAHPLLALLVTRAEAKGITIDALAAAAGHTPGRLKYMLRRGQFPNAEMFNDLLEAAGLMVDFRDEDACA